MAIDVGRRASHQARDSGCCRLLAGWPGRLGDPSPRGACHRAGTVRHPVPFDDRPGGVGARPSCPAIPRRACTVGHLPRRWCRPAGDCRSDDARLRPPRGHGRRALDDRPAQPAGGVPVGRRGGTRRRGRNGQSDATRRDLRTPPRIRSAGCGISALGRRRAQRACTRELVEPALLSGRAIDRRRGRDVSDLRATRWVRRERPNACARCSAGRGCGGRFGLPDRHDRRVQLGIARPATRLERHRGRRVATGAHGA